jgi:hypothetical protein
MRAAPLFILVLASCQSYRAFRAVPLDLKAPEPPQLDLVDAGSSESVDASAPESADAGRPESADASTPTPDGYFDTLRVDIPCLGPGGAQGYPWNCPCASAAQASTVAVTGHPGTRFEITIRVRGISEMRGYSGGAPALDAAGNYIGWYSGGSFIDNGWNVWQLAGMNGSTYAFLNATPDSITGHTVMLDYEQVIVVTGGDMLTLSGTSYDDVEVMNWSQTGQPMVVPDVPPAPAAFDGQFIQIDFVSGREI